MKRPLTAIAMFLTISMISTYSAFPAQKTSVTLKKAGRTTATAPNTILSGSGVPAKTIGIDGDFYIDIKNANLYGPKLKGTWKIATSLRLPVEKSVTANPVAGIDGAVGATGAKGSQGVQGVQGVQGDQGNVGAVGLQGVQGISGLTGLQGDTGANGLQGLSGAVGLTGTAGAKGDTGATGLTGLTGAKGDTGAAGINGTQGATGATGSVGATGSAGAQGATGSSGAQGATGNAGAVGAAGTNGTQGATGASGAQGVAGSTGLQGATGSAGSQGSTGATGSTGSQGIKGDTGTSGSQGIQGVKGDTGTTGSQGSTGAAGVSNSYYVEIQQWSLTIIQLLGYVDSTVFISLPSATSYTFQIVIDGIFSPGSFDSANIGMQVVSSSNLSHLQFRTFVSDTRTYINGIAGRHYQFLIIGTIVCGGESTDLKLRATDESGATLGGNTLLLTGSALLSRVGSVG